MVDDGYEDNEIQSMVPTVQVRLAQFQTATPGGRLPTLGRRNQALWSVANTFASAASGADAGSSVLKAKIAGTSSVLTAFRILPGQSRAPLRKAS